MGGRYPKGGHYRKDKHYWKGGDHRRSRPSRWPSGRASKERRGYSHWSQRVSAPPVSAPPVSAPPVSAPQVGPPRGSQPPVSPQPVSPQPASPAPLAPGGGAGAGGPTLAGSQGTRSRATGASAWSGSQSPAGSSITAGGPSTHGSAPISSYVPRGSGAGLTGTSVAGLSVPGTRAAGTSIAGLGLAAIPAEHWARRLASSRGGTGAGFTTEPSATIRRHPAFAGVGMSKGAAALPTVAASVAAAGSILPRSVNAGPPRRHHDAGIQRSPGEQTVAVEKPGPGPSSPPFGLRNQGASITAEAPSMRRRATPGPVVNPPAVPGLKSSSGLHRLVNRAAHGRRFTGSQPTADDGRPTRRGQPTSRGQARSWLQSTTYDRARLERTAGPRAQLPRREQFGAFRPPPRTPDGRAATRIPGLGAELAAGREQARTTSEILTVQRKNLSNQPGAL